jgi:TorA maturation chaperone TorD
MALDVDNGLIARLAMYRFLALGFHEPAEPLLTLLASEEEAQILREAADELGQDGKAESLYAAVEMILGAAPLAVSNPQDLRVEYNRLFVGPTRPPTPPYQSVYDHDRPEADWGTVEGPSAAWMHNALSHENLEVDLGHRELYDHVAIELEFMHYLLGKSTQDDSELSEKYLSRASFFLREFLSMWMPEFGELVASKTEHPLYQGLGKLLAAFVKQDAEQL